MSVATEPSKARRYIGGMSHAAPLTSIDRNRSFPVLARIEQAALAHRTRSAWIIVGLLLVIGFLIRLPQLGHRLAGAHSFWETQAAFTAREYAITGIDLFRTPLPVFGANASVPFDVPLVPALTSLLVRTGVDAATAIRIVGLAGFTTTGALLALLLMRWHSARAAALAVALFEFLPFGLRWGAGGFVDFVGIALALAMVAGLDAGMRGNRVWLVAGGAAGALAFLIAPTIAPLYLLLVAASAWIRAIELGWKTIRRPLAWGAIGPLVGCGLVIAWTVSADAAKAAHETTRFLTTGNLRDWLFGTLAERGDPHSYATIAGNLSDEIAGPALVGLIVALVALIVMRDIRHRILLAGLLAVVIAGPMVFLNQYVADSFPMIAIYPAAVGAMAVAAVSVARAVPLSAGRRTALTLTAAVLLIGSTAFSPNGRADLAQFKHEAPLPAASELLLQKTRAQDDIVMIGCDWDPTILFNANRSGVMFRGSSAGHFWDLNAITQYRYLLSCNPQLDPSPYLPPGYAAELIANGIYRVVPTGR